MLRKLEKCCLVTGVMGILLMGMPFNISASEDAAVQENSLESGNEVDHSQEGQLSKPKSLEGLEAISGEDPTDNTYGYYTIMGGTTVSARSEERRVGKECRSRWSPYH